MRIKISLEGHMWEIPAEQFSIDGTEEVFAVHVTAPKQIMEYCEEPLSASHVATGFRIATGTTIDEAIQNARDKWASKTPEEIAAAIAKANQINKEVAGA